MNKFKLNILALTLCSVMLAGCTYSVSMQHSVGSTDTMEEDQAASPTVSPTINVPITPGAGVGLPK